MATTTVDGRYEILSLLGEGAMCTVHEARQVELDRIVALKIPKSGILGSAGGLDRFLSEARNAARLRHPNVVAIHDVHHEEGGTYLVMELVAGGTLLEWRKAQRKLDDALELFEEVGQALVVAHEVGIVHRDLKPSNILLTPTGEVKVSDWGLSKALDNSEVGATASRLLGTPRYMAPEQLTRGKIGPWTDVYSLGVMIYETILLSEGEAHRPALELLSCHQSMAVPRLSTIVESLPGGLCELVAAMMEKEPTRRPCGAREVLAGLRALDWSQYACGGDETTRALSQCQGKAAPVGRVTATGTFSLAAASASPQSRTPGLIPVGIGLLACAAFFFMFVHGGGGVGPGGPARAKPVEVKSVRLTAVDRVEVRYAGPRSEKLRLTLLQKDGKPLTRFEPITLDLSTGGRVSRVNFLCSAVVSPAPLERFFARFEPGGGSGAVASPTKTYPLDPGPFLGKVLGPVDRLQGERLARLLQELGELKRRPTEGAEPVAEMARLLAQAGLDGKATQRLKRWLPRLVREDVYRGSPLARRLLPLRMVEGRIGDTAELRPPWGVVEHLLGCSFLATGPGEGRGQRRVVAVDPLEMNESGLVILEAEGLLKKVNREGLWDMMREGAYRVMSADRELDPRAVRESVDLELHVETSGLPEEQFDEAFIVLASGVWGRSYVLEARLNEGPPLALFNAGGLVGGSRSKVVGIIFPSFRVDPGHIRPGRNILSLRVRPMPGCRNVLPIAVYTVWLQVAP